MANVSDPRGLRCLRGVPVGSAPLPIADASRVRFPGIGMSAPVKGCGCRPEGMSEVARRPASASLQGRRGKPHERWELNAHPADAAHQARALSPRRASHPPRPIRRPAQIPIERQPQSSRQAPPARYGNDLPRRLSPLPRERFSPMSFRRTARAIRGEGVASARPIHSAALWSALRAASPWTAGRRGWPRQYRERATSAATRG